MELGMYKDVLGVLLIYMWDDTAMIDFSVLSKVIPLDVWQFNYTWDCVMSCMHFCLLWLPPVSGELYYWYHWYVMDFLKPLLSFEFHSYNHAVTQICACNYLLQFWFGGMVIIIDHGVILSVSHYWWFCNVCNIRMYLGVSLYLWIICQVGTFEICSVNVLSGIMLMLHPGTLYKQFVTV